MTDETPEDKFPRVEIDAAKLQEIKSRKFGAGSALTHEYKQAEERFEKAVEAYKESITPVLEEAKERQDAMMTVRVAKQRELSELESKRKLQQRMIDESNAKIKELKDTLEKASAKSANQRQAVDRTTLEGTRPAQELEALNESEAPVAAADGPPPPPSGGPPPPPPPPPAGGPPPPPKMGSGLNIKKSSASAEKSLDPQAALMAAIRGGKTLKKTDASDGSPSNEGASASLDPKEAMFAEMRGVKLRSAAAPRPEKKSGSSGPKPEELEGKIAELQAHADRLQQNRYLDLRKLHREIQKANANFEESKNFLLTADEKIAAAQNEVDEQNQLIERQQAHMAQIQQLLLIHEQQYNLLVQLQEAKTAIPLPEIEVASVELEAASIEEDVGVPAPPVVGPPPPPPPPAVGPPPPPPPPAGPKAMPKVGGGLAGIAGGAANLKKAGDRADAGEEKAPPPKPANMADIIAGSDRFKQRAKEAKEEERREAEAARLQAEEEARKEAEILAARQEYARGVLKAAKPSAEYVAKIKEEVAILEAQVAQLQATAFDNMAPMVDELTAQIETLKEEIVQAQLAQEADYQERLEAREAQLAAAAAKAAAADAESLELEESQEPDDDAEQALNAESEPKPDLGGEDKSDADDMSETPTPSKQDEMRAYVLLFLKELNSRDGTSLMRRINMEAGQEVELNQTQRLAITMAQGTLDLLHQDTHKSTDEKAEIVSGLLQNLHQQLKQDQKSYVFSVIDKLKEFFGHTGYSAVTNQIPLMAFLEKNLKKYEPDGYNMFLHHSTSVPKPKEISLSGTAPITAPQFDVNEYLRNLSSEHGTPLSSRIQTGRKKAVTLTPEQDERLKSAQMLIDVLNADPNKTSTEKSEILAGLLLNLEQQISGKKDDPLRGVLNDLIENVKKSGVMVVTHQTPLMAYMDKKLGKYAPDIVQKFQATSQNVKVSKEPLLQQAKVIQLKQPEIPDHMKAYETDIKLFNQFLIPYLQPESIANQTQSSIRMRYEQLGGKSHQPGSVRDAQIEFLQSCISQLYQDNNYSGMEKATIMAGILENLQVQLEKHKRSSKLLKVVNEMYNTLPQDAKTNMAQPASDAFIQKHHASFGGSKGIQAFVETQKTINERKNKPQKKGWW